MATRVILNKNKDKKIKNFYPNVFKDEVKAVMGKYNIGDIVNVCDEKLNFIGKGYINNNTNILVRVLTTKDEDINYEFFYKKIKEAYKKRTYLKKETNSKRIFFAEADGIPGFIADDFDGYLSVQFRNEGIEKYKDIIIKAILEIVKPKGIYERSDVENRVIEGVGEQTGIIYGEIPDKIIMEDNDLRYIVDIINGQKTGFFLDQRESRKFIRRYLNKETKFLDVFSSSGGFSIAALKEGCQKVVAIDKDKYALKLCHENYNLNKFKNEFKTIEGDAFEVLKDIVKSGEQYDVITLDPPSLIKKKTERKKGREFFYNLCLDSFKIIKNGGIVGIITCAYNITLQDLIETSRMAASENEQILEVLGVNYQPNDHPWILHIPETLYLKCLWVRVYKK
ncbi:SAM-dependent methyltransferase [Hypnocyclicus thermotrophus]|uniref:SAM-dependent methyltransferase n=1 Tax=Hypnocyclicus thermotrophus TaxID=1627895 RepID=A0AA46DXZ0_9FUSO|nr:class I SAM-dependent rRNA methyltransferase [Hypnocyclicus thermotrophus]TDT69209.1 SAM-dependent methyltransferase [Hypnocyclicus thermotrophus]